MNHKLENRIQLFEDRKIRTAWDEETEEWYFSIVDVVGVLTEQADYQRARKYWNKLKQRLTEEGSQLVTDCHQLKMNAEDGKKRLTDVATTEQLLRLIQSVPSKKAEPGVQKGVEYAILTDEITKAWSGMSTRQYKKYKGLKKENLRDNMSTLELVLNMLAEATTTEISREKRPETLEENRIVAQEGGAAAGEARQAVEKRTGKPVITDKNAAQLQGLVTDLLEGE